MAEKKYSKTVTNPKTGRKRTVRYGAKGYSISPGTSRGDNYCTRSFGQMKKHPKAAKDPTVPCACHVRSGVAAENDHGEIRYAKCTW